MRRLVPVLAGLFVTPTLFAQPSFEIAMPADGFRVTSGRIVVSLISEESRLFERAEPASAPFFSDPQPMFSTAWQSEEPFTSARFESFEVSFPFDLKDLPPGTYKAQAVFDRKRRDSNWRREADNPYSPVVEFTWDGKTPVTVPLEMTEITKAEHPPAVEGVQWIGRYIEHEGKNGAYDGWMSAGVVLPKDRDAVRLYPTVYVIPGFGGNRDSAAFYKRALDSDRMGDAWQRLHENATIVVLDPESANGHHLFANSANNGAVGDALVHEFIPILESEFGLLPSPDARIITGHSSGGWSSVWLALEYPETFGGAFSSAPDPVDFRFFQQVNIYEDDSMYADADGNERASSTRDGEVTMTIREENLMEEVLGPDNTSAQQWDSWLAVFGPRGDGGNPADLYDGTTGALDHGVARAFASHDITHRLRENPERYVPIFESNIRLLVGEEDTYDLDLAVSSLLETLTELGADVNGDDKPGYVKIIPGANHGSIRRTEESRAFPAQMLEFFLEGGFAE